MTERYAVGVIWHGADLIFEQSSDGQEVKYTFPGDQIIEEETPTAALSRILTKKLNFPFSKESLGKVRRSFRDEHRLALFYEAAVPHGAIQLPKPAEDKFVFWQPDQVELAIEEALIAPWSAEYIKTKLWL